MELQQAVAGKPWIPKLTFEDYLNLEHLDILMMHGFKSNKVAKHDLLDAVRSIDLMDAHHSTLQSDVSSNAFLDLNEVIKDLSALHWQECCIASIETVNSEAHFSCVVNDSSLVSFKLNSNTASSLKDDSEAHKTQSRSFKKSSFKDDSEAHKTQSRSSKKSCSKDDSEAHRSESRAFKKIKGPQVDQDNSRKYPHERLLCQLSEETVDQIKISKPQSGKQVGQLPMPKGSRKKQVGQVYRHKAQIKKQVGQANKPEARKGKQVGQVNTPKARNGIQVGQANTPKTCNGEQVDQTNKADTSSYPSQTNSPTSNAVQEGKPTQAITWPARFREEFHMFY
uniref:uncharacterized protein LOC122604262 n=1 Tax=Erigeron canadensis TaxID=72917 RepID=UPI001CB9B9FE|nr:uncharacterized protein LOC122604262 [Erigeron canadensis]